MSVKNSPQSANFQNKTPKPAVVKKSLAKSSPLPATRKSWPSTPLPRSTGASPAKVTPDTSSSIIPTCRRSQPTPSTPQSHQRVERSLLQPKSVKVSHNDARKSFKKLTEKKQQPLIKASKPTKTKSQAIAVDSASSAKPIFYSKVTEKSSVVPLELKEAVKEPKPFLPKGSKVGSGVGPATKTKVSSPPEGSLRDSDDLVQAKEKKMDPVVSEPVNEQEDRRVADFHSDLETESQVKSPQNNKYTESSNQFSPSNEDDFQKTQEPVLNDEVEEESSISSAAWVEIEEHEDAQVQCNDCASHSESLANTIPVKVGSPRVHHSLSQMLLEESIEPDVVDWGNAENPPTVVYQKDAPKGLKRLLNFARKTKTDANSRGLSSPSVFSEGEDDTEETKALSKKGSENLLKKARLHVKNYGNQKASSNDVHNKNLAGHKLSAQATIGKLVAQSLYQNLLEGHVSTSTSTTKAARSFFSLSAFKVNK